MAFPMRKLPSGVQICYDDCFAQDFMLLGQILSSEISWVCFLSPYTFVVKVCLVLFAVQFCVFFDFDDVAFIGSNNLPGLLGVTVMFPLRLVACHFPLASVVLDMPGFLLSITKVSLSMAFPSSVILPFAMLVLLLPPPM